MSTKPAADPVDTALRCGQSERMTGLADVPEIEWHELDELTAVVEEREYGILTALLLWFGERAVRFEALGEDDTLLIVEVGGPGDLRPTPPATEGRGAVELVLYGHHSSEPVRAQIGQAEPWSRFLGTSVRWGRAMINHHGYLDGYQLEFAQQGSSIGDAIEMVVAASGIVVGTARFN